ncbi:MAG: Mur ligase family protein [Gemmatimonadaceae bacterium]
MAPEKIEARLEGWRRAMLEILSRIGWTGESIVVRCNSATGRGGAFLTAPLDGLLAATEVNEQAWLAMERTLSGGAPDYNDIAARLRVSIQHDLCPALTTLVDAAHGHSLSVAMDDDRVIIGSGTGSRAWPIAALPDVASVPWHLLHDIPIALVTGSNGKTTTTRLLASMLCRAGNVTGWSCTDGVWVDDDIVAEGDYSGPAGARLVVQDARVTAAVLETARGGILRRGLAVERAQVAIVTNVAADHLGEYGVDDLRSLGETKLVVARVVSPAEGRVVLNADDKTLRSLAGYLTAPISWFSVDGSLADLLPAGGDAFVLEDQILVAILSGKRHALVRADELPLSFGGVLRYNIANALAASAAAIAMGVSIDDVRETLRVFGSSISDNPGRLAMLELRGARLLVDFVHNPDGWDAVTDGLAHIEGRRVAVVGQAGDRDNRALHDLATAVWRLAPELLILKEMPSYLRGRPLGETTEILAAEFLAMGASPERLLRAADELAAIDLVAENARAGDVTVLGVHDDFDAAIARLLEHGAVLGRWT